MATLLAAVTAIMVMGAHRGYSPGARRSLRGWKPVLTEDAEDTYRV